MSETPTNTQKRSRKGLGARKNTNPKREELKQKLADLISVGASRASMLELKDEYHISERQLYFYKRMVLESMRAEYLEKHPNKLAEAIARKQWYVKFYKTKYASTSNIRFIERAEKSERELIELMTQFGVLPDFRKAPFEFTQNNIVTNKSIFEVLKEDTSKTLLELQQEKPKVIESKVSE